MTTDVGMYMTPNVRINMTTNVRIYMITNVRIYMPTNVRPILRMCGRIFGCAVFPGYHEFSQFPGTPDFFWICWFSGYHHFPRISGSPQCLPDIMIFSGYHGFKLCFSMQFDIDIVEFAFDPPGPSRSVPRAPQVVEVVQCCSAILAPSWMGLWTI